MDIWIWLKHGRLQQVVYWGIYRSFSPASYTIWMAAKNICSFYDNSCSQVDSVMLLFLIGLLSGIVSGMGIGRHCSDSVLDFCRCITAYCSKYQSNLIYSTALVALLVHWKNKHVRFKIAFQLILAGAAGAVAGSWLASSWLRFFLENYSGISSIMGIYELFRKTKEKD